MIQLNVKNSIKIDSRYIAINFQLYMLVFVHYDKYSNPNDMLKKKHDFFLVDSIKIRYDMIKIRIVFFKQIACTIVLHAALVNVAIVGLIFLKCIEIFEEETTKPTF